MKRICRLLFLGCLSITLAVIFVAGYSSKNDAKSENKKGKKDRTTTTDHHRSNKSAGEIA